MNGFDDDPMGGILEESDREILLCYMKTAENRFFPASPKIEDIQIVKSPDPAILMNYRFIQISQNVIRCTKMCKVLILHELIHQWLNARDGDPDEDEGVVFQAEIERLWNEKAYRGIL